MLLATLGSADASARILAKWNGKPALNNRLAPLMLVRRGFASSLGPVQMQTAGYHNHQPSCSCVVEMLHPDVWLAHNGILEPRTRHCQNIRVCLAQKSWKKHNVIDMDATSDLWALVAALSAFLLAHSREANPTLYRRELLLQTSAQLATMPCAPCSELQNLDVTCPTWQGRKGS